MGIKQWGCIAALLVASTSAGAIAAAFQGALTSAAFHKAGPGCPPPAAARGSGAREGGCPFAPDGPVYPRLPPGPGRAGGGGGCVRVWEKWRMDG